MSLTLFYAHEYDVLDDDDVPEYEKATGKRVVKLGAFNGGESLSACKLTLCDGRVLIGLLQEEKSDCLVMRVASRVLPVSVPLESVDRREKLVESRMPEIVYDDNRDKQKVLGGVGEHTRRVLYPDSETGEVGAVVTNFGEDIGLLAHALRDVGYGARFATEPPELIREDESTLCPVVLNGNNLTSACTRLAAHGIFTYVPGVRPGSILNDSLNRAKHLFRDPFLGPTRALYRFRFAHLPDRWKQLPFSWGSWASNVVDDLEADGELSRVHELELPLRSYVEFEIEKRERGRARVAKRSLQQRDHDFTALLRRMNDLLLENRRLAQSRRVHAKIADISFAGAAMHSSMAQALQRECDRMMSDEITPLVDKVEAMRVEIAEASARAASVHSHKRKLMPVPHHVIPSLSKDESFALLEAFHGFYYDYANLSDEDREVKKARLFHGPMCHGFYPHWVSAYESSGDYVGFGKNLRRPLSADAPVPAAVRNRMRVVGNTLAGRGSQGYKGLFEPPEDCEKLYQPKKQLVRTDLDNMHLRRAPVGAGDV